MEDRRGGDASLTRARRRGLADADLDADFGLRADPFRRELVQETYRRAWLAYGAFEGRSSLRTWLYRIATNVCLTALAGRQRTKETDLVYQSNGYVLDERPGRLGRLEPTPDPERHDRAALHRRLEDNGYLFIRGALDPDDVRDFRRYYFNALAGTGLTGDARDSSGALGVSTGAGGVDREELRRRLFREIVPGRVYEEFCTQPAIRDWYAWFLGEEPFLHKRRIIRHIVPGENGIGSATQAHYDLLYLRGGSDRVLSSWVPLGDCPVELGGLAYLEGSHHRVRADEAAADPASRRPAASITADLPALADEYDARWLLADYEAGDMVVHTAHTVHAALDNVGTDGTVRLSTDIRYQRADDPIDGRWQNFWDDRDGL